LSLSDLSRLRLDSAPFRTRNIIRQIAVRVARETFGKRFKEIAEFEEMSERYQDALRFHLEGDILGLSVVMTLDYQGDNGEPLGIWFEEGTKDHFIAPKDKKALRFEIGNQVFFSKGHWVKGIKERHIIQRTVQEGLPEFANELKKQIEAELERTKLR
jgi:hypothetical protein